MLDLYEQETDRALARLPQTQTPETGIFDGFVRGAALSAVRTGIKTVARPLAMVGSLGAAIYDNNTEAGGWDAISDGTSAKDRYFKTMDEVFDSAIDYWTPKPGEVGAAGEVVGQLLGLLPIVIASPATAVAGTYLDTATELSKKGVGDWRAQAVGAAQAAGLGAGIWMPILGSSLWQRMLVGGAGFNVLQGITMRGAGAEILKGHPAAEEFKALDGTALTLDVLLGMAFGAVTHLSPAQRSQGAEAWRRIGEWAKDMTPTQIAAAAVLRQAQHLNLDSLPGKPVAPADLEAHVERMRVSLEQVERGQPVSVEGIGRPAVEPQPVAPAEVGKAATPTPRADVQDTAPRFEPNPERLAEMQARTEELVAEAETVRVEEGLPPQEQVIIRAEEAPKVPEVVEPAKPQDPAAALGDAVRGDLEAVGVPPDKAAAVASKLAEAVTPKAPETEQTPLSKAADSIVAQNGERVIRVGTGADGEKVTMTAREYLDNARADVAQAREDMKLFELAAGCLLTGGA